MDALSTKEVKHLAELGVLPPPADGYFTAQMADLIKNLSAVGKYSLPRYSPDGHARVVQSAFLREDEPAQSLDCATVVALATRSANGQIVTNPIL